MSIRRSSYGLMIFIALCGAGTAAYWAANVRSDVVVSREQCVYYNGACVPISILRLTVSSGFFP